MSPQASPRRRPTGSPTRRSTGRCSRSTRSRPSSRRRAASCTRSTASRSRSSGARPSASWASRARGKSVLSRSIMGLLPEQRRAARQHQVRGPRDRQRRRATRCASYWGTQMSMVFQDPMTSLNPVMRIGKQITEPLRYHLDVSRDYAEDTALALLQSVGHPRGRAPARGVPAPALRRHAPARDDRDRARVRPEAAVRRRAHHRARRHGAGADPRPAATRSSANASWRWCSSPTTSASSPAAPTTPR